MQVHICLYAFLHICQTYSFPPGATHTLGISFPFFLPPCLSSLTPLLPKGQTINMTAPVTMMEEPLDGDANRYQMCFYIPAAHQLEPPKPTDPNVYIEVRPRLTVAAR